MPSEEKDPKVYLKFDDFSGGWNDNSDPLLLASNEVSDIENFVYDENNKLRIRGGILARYSQAIGEKIIKIFPYYRKNGNKYLIICTKNAIYYDFPRWVKEYSSQAQVEQGGQGCNVTVAGDGHMSISAPTPTFARTSVAYNDDGTQTAQNIPRYKSLWR